MDIVSFSRMDQGTAEEYRFLEGELANHARDVRAKLPGVALKFLREQQGDALGYRVDHSSTPCRRRPGHSATAPTKKPSPLPCCTISAVASGCSTTRNSQPPC